MVWIDVPEVLREKLGADGTKALVDLLNEVGGRLRDDLLGVTDDRFGRRLAEERGLFDQAMARDRERFERAMARDREHFRQEVAAIREGIARDFAALRQEMTQEFAAVRVEISDVKSDLTWRLFYFWAAHLVAIAGLLLAFFKLFGT